MSFPTILYSLFFLGMACAVGMYWWRALKSGKILAGFRYYRADKKSVETWFVRKDDAISYWMVMFFVGFMGAGFFWISVSSLIR